MTPALIFMDLQMPDIDGVEASATIKIKHPKLPVIAFTASIFDEIGSNTLFQCFDDYLFKPVEKQAIYHLLTKYLNVLPVFNKPEITPVEKDWSYYHKQFLRLDESQQKDLVLWLIQGQLTKIREFANQRRNQGNQHQEVINKIYPCSKDYQMQQFKNLFLYR